MCVGLCSLFGLASSMSSPGVFAVVVSLECAAAIGSP